jgi:ketosteroid isomerase-like protein
MPVLTAEFARHFAAEWIAAWNAHDLDAVLAHYHDDFVFASPYIVQIAGEPSGVLTGKPAVRAYWSAALQRIPELRFELVDVLAGVDALTLYYRGHRGMAAEVFLFDAEGRVRRSFGTYAVG